MPGAPGTKASSRPGGGDAAAGESGIMIDGELSDPALPTATVSEWRLNPGGKSARVYVAVDHGGEEH